MKNVDTIFKKCVNLALNSLSSEEKAELLSNLQKQSFNMDNLSTGYEVFHSVLKQTFGRRHHLIERKIIKNLHTGALKGDYSVREEIQAFALMVGCYLEESDESLKKLKELYKR